MFPASEIDPHVVPLSSRDWPLVRMDAEAPSLATDAFVLLEDTSRRQWLHKSITGQNRLLDQHEEGAWEMEFNDNGVPFLHIDTTELELWAPDLFGVNAYRVHNQAGTLRILEEAHVHFLMGLFIAG